MHLNYLIVFFTIFMFNSCKSSKETISFEQITEGRYLDKVQEICVDEFFQI